MSAGEYVVIQVRGNETDSTWMDYSRCTARQAQGFLLSSRASRTDKGWRVKHWITGGELGDAQLARMVSDELGRFEDKAPGAGDFWNVTVTFDSDKGWFPLVTSVDDWRGPAWDALVRDVAAKAASEGWTVKSVLLKD